MRQSPGLVRQHVIFSSTITIFREVGITWSTFRIEAKVDDGPGKHAIGQRLVQCSGGIYLRKRGFRAGLIAL